MSKYKDRKYTIEKYNSDWKNQFEKEARVLQCFFDKVALSVEHIGSTAVPNLSGKPTIDVLVVVSQLTDVNEIAPFMTESGYKDMGEYVTKNSRLFVREKNNERLVNVHIFPKDHPHIIEMLKVRDYLRTHPEKVTEYNNLKQNLYKKYPNDYAMYRKYKDEWMKDLVSTI